MFLRLQYENTSFCWCGIRHLFELNFYFRKNSFCCVDALILRELRCLQTLFIPPSLILNKNLPCHFLQLATVIKWIIIQLPSLKCWSFVIVIWLLASNFQTHHLDQLQYETTNNCEFLLSLKMVVKHLEICLSFLLFILSPPSRARPKFYVVPTQRSFLADGQIPREFCCPAFPFCCTTIRLSSLNASESRPMAYDPQHFFLH